MLHEVNLAAFYCDRLGILKAGRVLAAGRPAGVVDSGILSAAYDDPIEANTLPRRDIPFALPMTV